MDLTWRHLPPPARPIASAASAAVSAAQARDPDALDAAVDGLAALDATQTGLVLGTVVRLLLEDGNPDGLDGEAVRDALELSVRRAAEWQPEVDPHIMLLLLAGSLGVVDEDDSPPPKPDVVARHTALLLAHLLGDAQRPLAPWLTAALADIERTQLND
jgi:hypothetical protein